MNRENSNGTEKSVTHRFAQFFLAGGALICLLMTIDSLGSLPFSMPRSWYTDREIWTALGIVGLIAGFLMQRPEKGDEYDTT